MRLFTCYTRCVRVQHLTLRVLIENVSPYLSYLHNRNLKVKGLKIAKNLKESKHVEKAKNRS